jgi:hypothetical protein
MKMRATYAIYEDPSSFSSDDIWDTNSGDPTDAKLKGRMRLVYAVMGLVSMGAVTSYVAYAWNNGSLSSLPFPLGFGKVSSQRL